MKAIIIKKKNIGKEHYLLRKEKIYQFIEDVLSNKKVASVLYATNAKKEIKAYNKIKQSFDRRKDGIEKKLKSKNESSSVVKRRNRKETFIKIKNEISSFKINKEKYKRSLTQSNNRRAKKLKEEREKEKKEYFDDLRSNFIKGYRRAFSRLKFKLDILKLGTGGGILETVPGHLLLPGRVQADEGLGLSGRRGDLRHHHRLRRGKPAL